METKLSSFSRETKSSLFFNVMPSVTVAYEAVEAQLGMVKIRFNLANKNFKVTTETRS